MQLVGSFSGKALYYVPMQRKYHSTSLSEVKAEKKCVCKIFLMTLHNRLLSRIKVMIAPQPFAVKKNQWYYHLFLYKNMCQFENNLRLDKFLAIDYNALKD